MSLTRAIQAIELNTRIEMDLGAKLVTVSSTGGPADRIALTITAAGYPAEVLPAVA